MSVHFILYFLFSRIETQLKFGELSTIVFKGISGDTGSPVCQRKGGNTILIRVEQWDHHIVVVVVIIHN